MLAGLLRSWRYAKILGQKFRKRAVCLENLDELTGYDMVQPGRHNFARDATLEEPRIHIHLVLSLLSSAPRCKY